MALQAQVTIEINSAFSLTPLTDTLFLTGDFNNWNEHDQTYAFSRTGINTFELTFTPSIGALNYKITRGTWASVESNANGTYLSNRALNYSGTALSESISILGWEDIGGQNQSSASDNTYLLDLNFNMPTLSRNRRIWVYLPPDYETSSKLYPVVYMQDAQNLFDQAYAPFGEWEVDESMNDLFYNQADFGAIIVGIDHGDIDRINEYSPWINPGYGGGQGDEYMNFLVQDLVPYVDANFRTIANPNARALIGSSMGGLISQYGVIEHPNTFRKGGIMSPAFWFSSDLYTHVHTQGIHPMMKFYFVSGTTESSSMVPLMNQMRDSLLSLGLPSNRIEFQTHADGQHSEWFWSREYPAVYTWLFNDLSTSNSMERQSTNMIVYPNPSKSLLYLENTPLNAMLNIYNLQGQLMYTKSLKNESQTLNISFLNTGIYLLEITHPMGVEKLKFIKD